MRRHLRAAALMVVAGCASAPGVRPPARGGRPWIEARSPHFALSTDLSVADARGMLEQFEKTFALFATRLFPSKDPPETHIEVVVFADEGEFAGFRIRPYGAGQYDNGNDIIDCPTIVMWGARLDRFTAASFQHELTHRFVHHYLPDPPVWLNEGLADYYATARAYLGDLYLGLPRRRPRRTALPRLGELIAVSREQFYDPKHATDHYDAAWSLVHFLRNTKPDLAQRFDRYFAALDDKTHHDQAWRDAFGDLDAGALEEAWRRHVASLSTEAKLWRSPWNEPAPPPVTTRSLGNDEVLLLWVRVRPRGTKMKRLIEADLAQALAAKPRRPEADYWQGWLHSDEAALVRAVEAAPNEERYQLALTNLRFDRARALNRLPDAEPEVRKLFRLAHSPESLNAIAWYYALREQPEVGLPFARRALEHDPGCWECLDTWALLAFQMRAYADAVAMQQRAIELVPEERKVPGEMLERLAKFRAAAGAPAGAAAVTPAVAAPPPSAAAGPSP